MKHVSSKSVDFRKLQILDLYVLFPAFLKRLKFPNELRSKRKIAEAIEDPYEVLPDPRKLLFELTELHKVSIKYLYAKGIIVSTNAELEEVQLVGENIPVDLNNALDSDSVKNEEWFRLLVDDISKLDVDGKNGLKHRSGLMEHRYDA